MCSTLSLLFWTRGAVQTQHGTGPHCSGCNCSQFPLIRYPFALYPAARALRPSPCTALAASHAFFLTCPCFFRRSSPRRRGGADHPKCVSGPEEMRRRQQGETRDRGKGEGGGNVESSRMRRGEEAAPLSRVLFPCALCARGVARKTARRVHSFLTPHARVLEEATRTQRSIGQEHSKKLRVLLPNAMRFFSLQSRYFVAFVVSIPILDRKSVV